MEPEDFFPTDPDRDLSLPENQPTGDGASKGVDLTDIIFNQDNDVLPTTRISNLDPSKFAPYMEGVDESIGDIYERRAQNQSGWEQLFRAGRHFGNELIGGTTEGIGILLNIPKFFDDSVEGKEKWENSLTQLGQHIRDQGIFGGGTEAAPIYKTKGAEGFSPGHWSWWMSHAPQLATSLSIMLPAAGVAKGVTGAASLLAKLGKGSKQLSAITRQGFETISGAVAARHIESTMEAYQNYQSVYDQAIGEGYGEEKAKLAASQAASDTYNFNWAALATEIPQYAFIFKGANFANRALSETLKKVSLKGSQDTFLARAAAFAKSKPGDLTNADLAKFGGKGAILRELAKQSGLEGLEEIYQGAVSSESAAKAQEILDPFKSQPDFNTRITEYFKDPETWNAGFWGALGGAVFSGGKPLVDAVSGRFVEQEKMRLNDLIRRADDVRGFLQVAAYINVDDQGNPISSTLAEDAVNTLITDIAIKAAHKGEIGLEKAMFETVSKMSDEQLEVEGLSEDARVRAQEALTIISKAEEVYNKWSNKNISIDGEYSDYAGLLIDRLVRNDLNIELGYSHLDKLRAANKELIEKDNYFKQNLEDQKRDLEKQKEREEKNKQRDKDLGIVEVEYPRSDDADYKEKLKLYNEITARNNDIYEQNNINRLDFKLEDIVPIPFGEEYDSWLSGAFGERINEINERINQVNKVINELSQENIELSIDSNKRITFLKKAKEAYENKKKELLKEEARIADEQKVNEKIDQQAEKNEQNPPVDKAPVAEEDDTRPTTREGNSDVTDEDLALLPPEIRAAIEKQRKGIDEDTIRQDQKEEDQEKETSEIDIASLLDNSTPLDENGKPLKIVDEEESKQASGLSQDDIFVSEDVNIDDLDVETPVSKEEGIVDEQIEATKEEDVDPITASGVGDSASEVTLETGEEVTLEDGQVNDEGDVTRLDGGNKITSSENNIDTGSVEEETNVAAKTAVTPKTAEEVETEILESDGKAELIEEEPVNEGEIIISDPNSEEYDSIVFKAAFWSEKISRDGRKVVRGEIDRNAVDYFQDKDQNPVGKKIRFHLPDREMFNLLIERGAATEEQRKLYTSGKSIVQKGEKYFIGDTEVFPSEIPIRFTVLDNDGRDLIYNGNTVEVWTHVGSKAQDNTDKNKLTSIKIAIFNALANGRIPSSQIISRSSGFIAAKDHLLPAKASRPVNDVFEQVGIGKEYTLAVAIDDGSITDRNNEPLTRYEGSRGNVFAIIKDLQGFDFPFKLNVRSLSNTEAELIWAAYADLLEGKRLVDTISKDNPRFQALKTYGMTYKELLNILVYEGTATGKLYAKKNQERILGLSENGKQVRVGKQRLDKSQFIAAKDNIIKHLKANKLHNINRNNLSQQGNRFNNVTSTDQISILGATYKVTEVGSYDKYLSDRKVLTSNLPPAYSDGETISNLFVQPIIRWDTNIAIDEVGEVITPTKTPLATTEIVDTVLGGQYEVVIDPDSGSLTVTNLKTKKEISARSSNYVDAVVEHLVANNLEPRIIQDQVSSKIYDRIAEQYNANPKDVTTPQSLPEEVTPVEERDVEFDEDLNTRLRKKLAELYPEIQLKYTNEPIIPSVDPDVFNQTIENRIDYQLTVVEILNSEKSKKIFAKGIKNNWSLDKILTELHVPKEIRNWIAQNVDNDVRDVEIITEALVTSLYKDIYINKVYSLGYENYGRYKSEGTYGEYTLSLPDDSVVKVKPHTKFGKETDLLWIRNDVIGLSERILEFQSDLFQKNVSQLRLTTGKETDPELTSLIERHWIRFTLNAIIQNAAKQGFQEILFPKAEAVIDIQDFRRAASISFDNYFNNLVVEELDTLPEEVFEIASDSEFYFATASVDKITQYLESSFKNIIKLYDEIVPRLLSDKVGENNIDIVTDAKGREWTRIKINHTRDLSPIHLQKDQYDRIIGQANIKAATVLIDAVNQKQDTLPHEYAHHYIAWYRDTPIVQEAIKKWGSEEALVQAIGEQAVLQKGEAWNWWKKFVNFILEKLGKEEIKNLLTDAFLTRRDLTSSESTKENSELEDLSAADIWQAELDNALEKSKKPDKEGFISIKGVNFLSLNIGQTIEAKTAWGGHVVGVIEDIFPGNGVEDAAITIRILERIDKDKDVDAQEAIRRKRIANDPNKNILDIETISLEVSADHRVKIINSEVSGVSTKEDAELEALKKRRKPRDPNAGYAYRLASFMPRKVARIDIAKERAWLRRNLPGIDVEVIDELIQTRNRMHPDAFGSFAGGLITLSKKAAAGTGYHEAFHAVFRTYLTPTEVDILLDEAQKVYPKVSREMLEEKLADDFMMYIISDGRIKFPQPKTSNLFKKLWNWIKNIFSNRLTVNKLFARINAGGFVGAQPIDATIRRFKNQVAFKPAGLTQENYEEVISVLAYKAIRINPDGTPRTDFGPEALESVSTNHVMESVVDNMLFYEEAGNTEMYERYKFIWDNREELLDALDIFFARFGLVRGRINRIDEENDNGVETDGDDEVGKGGGLNIRPPYESSSKEGATLAVKLFVAIQPSKKENGTFLGQPRLINYSIAWSKLEQTLSGSVDVPDDATGGHITAKQMMELRLEALSQSDPDIDVIYDAYQKASQELKSQFFKAFTLSNQNFVNFTWMKKGNKVLGKIFPALQTSTIKKVRRQWENNFYASSIFKEDGSIDQKTLNSIKFDLSKLIKKIKSLKKTAPANIINELVDVFNAIGVNIDFATLNQFIGKRADPVKSIKFLTTRLRTALNSENFKRSLTEIKDIGFNLVSSEKIFEELAEIYVKVNDILEYENTVFGSENKPYWIYSNPNYLQDEVNRIRYSSRYTQSLYERNPYSLWLRYLAANENDVERQNFNYETYLNYQEEEAGDPGQKWSELSEPDELFYRINAVLTGHLPTLNMSDKETQMFITGIPLVRDSAVFNKGGKLGIRKNTINSFTNYLFAELNRLRVVHQHKTSLEEHKKVQNLHTQEKLLLFPSFSFDKIKGTELGNILYHADGVPKLLGAEERNHPLVRQKMEEVIIQRVRDQVNSFAANNFIVKKDNKYTVKKEFLFDELWSDYLKDNAKNEQNAIISAITDFTVNSLVSHFEQAMIFHGDYAAYKVKSEIEGELDDLRKRTSSVQAYKNRGDDSVIPRNFKVIVLQDQKIDSEYHDHYKDIFLKAFDGDEVRASQYAAPYNNVNIADAQGYVTLPRYRDILLMHGLWTDRHQRTYDKALKGESLGKGAALFTPLKPVHFEVQSYHGLNVPVYLKYSVAPLLPEVIKDTPLHALNERMIKDGIDEAIFESGVKVGARGLVDLNNLPVGEEALRERAIVLNNSNYGIQVQVPTKGTKKRLAGSQQRKIMLSGIITDADYELDGRNVKGASVAQALNDIYSDLSNLGKRRLLKRLGLKENADGGFEIKDHKKFHDILLKELERREVGQEVIKSIRLDANGFFVAPFLSGPHRIELENALFAILNKATIKSEVLGGSFVQVSSATTSMKLKPPRVVKGKLLPGQVLIPMPKQWKEKYGSYEEIKEKAPELLKMISYRIPTQSKASIDVLEIAGFLPDEMGDSIIFYDEITAKVGSDFDIDKAYFFIPNMDKDGGFATAEREYRRRYATLKRAYGDIYKRVKEAYPDLEITRRTAPGKVYKLAKQAGFAFTKDQKKTIKKVRRMPSLKDFTEKYKGEAVISNRVFSVYDSIFSSKHHRAEVLTPIDGVTGPIKKIANSFEKDVISGDMHEFSALNQMRNKRTFKEGKELIGMVSNSNTDHALSILSGFRINPIFFPKNAYKLDGDLAQIYNVDGTLIGDVLSAYMNATVDVAKDPYISRLQFNTYTAGTILLMTRAGFSPEVIFNFLNQPAIKDLIRATNIADSKILSSNFNAEQKILERYIKRSGLTSVQASKVEGYVPKLSKLKSGLISKPDNAEYNAEQIAILKAFIDFNQLGRTVTRSIVGAKADVNGAGKKAAELEVLSNSKLDASSSEFLQGYEAKFQGTMLGTMTRNSVDLARVLFKDIILGLNPSVRITTRRILYGMMKRKARYDEAIIDTIHREIYNYLLSGSPLHPETNKEIFSFFVGKNTLAKRLERIKKSSINNFLIEFLSYEIDKTGTTPDWIIAYSSKRTGFHIDDLSSAWRELLENDKTRPFAIDLAKYAYITSGMQKTIFGFHDLIPFELLEEIKQFDYLREIVEPDVDNFNFSPLDALLFGDNFIDQFFRHNYRDNKIVPKVNLKKLPTKEKGEGWFVLDPNRKAEFEELVIDSEIEQYLPFVKTVSGNRITLYRMDWNNNGDIVYREVDKLGYYERGKRIYEYKLDKKTDSIFIINKSNYKTDQETVETQQTEIVKEEREKEIDVVEPKALPPITDKSSNNDTPSIDIMDLLDNATPLDDEGNPLKEIKESRKDPEDPKEC